MRFLLRNWHLKLASVLVATVLYTGLVFSGTLSEDRLQVPIRLANQPTDAYNLTGDRGFVEVRYRTGDDATSLVSVDAFVARVDLSQYDMERAPEPQVLQVEVTAPGIDIIDWSPRTVRVELDRIDTRTVPVEVDTGEIPAGLELGKPELSEADGQVEVRGPASEINRVDRALARILIDPSGIDFDQPVTLIPVDIDGQPIGIGRLELLPELISVRVDVEDAETTTTVPVAPDIQGTPAPGYALEGIGVSPATVTLRGLPEVLARLDEVTTEPLDIGGVSATQVFEAALVLPEGTELARSGAATVVSVEAVIAPSVSSRSFVVGIVCQGAGANGCQPTIEQLTLTLTGSGGVFRALEAADLTPIVDVSGLAPGTYTLNPIIPALPEGVEILQIVPGSITVRIVAPAQPSPIPTP